MSVELNLPPARRGYHVPTSVEEALTLARRHPGEYEYYAGGTDAHALRQIGLPRPPLIIDLSGIRALSELRVAGNEIRIGSMVTLDRLLTDSALRASCPLLTEAAASVATPVIRKTATIGGNLLVSNRCVYYNQSERWRTALGSCLRDTGDTCHVTGIRHGKCFSRNVSDTAAALIALDAVVTIRNQQTELSVPLHDLYAPDGLHSLRHLGDDGILTGIRVAAEVKAWGYRKLRLRRALDFSSLTVAAYRNTSGAVRICLNGVSMAPVLITGDASTLPLDEIIRQARRGAKLVDNDLMSFEHRKDMLAVYLEDLWHELQADGPSVRA